MNQNTMELMLITDKLYQMHKTEKSIRRWIIFFGMCGLGYAATRNGRLDKVREKIEELKISKEE